MFWATRWEAPVIWSYLDLFGPEKLRKLVIVDQAPMVAALPGWSDAEKKRYGCLLPDVQSVAGFCDMVRATSTIDGTMGILKGMFTAAMPDTDLRWIAEENLKMPRAAAADLLFDHCLNDWRDVIERHGLPHSSSVDARASSRPSRRSGSRPSIPTRRAIIFEENEGGGHFMFFENPPRFNAEVVGFPVILETTSVNF